MQLPQRWSRRTSLSGRTGLLLRILRRYRGLRFANLFLTRKCNLRCAYCATWKPETEDLSLAQWKEIIDRLHAWGIHLFALTGGEPTTRPDLEDIIRHLAEAGDVIWLNTNLTLVDRARVQRLADAGS